MFSDSEYLRAGIGQYFNRDDDRRDMMDKKNVLGLLFFMGVLGVAISGMVAFQPDKVVYQEASSAQQELQAFPSLPAGGF